MEGAGGNPETFLYGGLVNTVGIATTILELSPLKRFEHVLDFGCGSGRLALWLRYLHEEISLHGVDINDDAINWCKSHIDDVDFSLSAPKPPLGFDDASMDLVVAISVMTHLDETYQDEWLAEPRRITKPGGLVMLTVHGPDTARLALRDGRDEYAELMDKGFVYLRATDSASVEGLPDFYQVAYHTKNYIEQSWLEGFRPMLFVPHGPYFRQDMVVMQRDDGDNARSESFREVYLPMACLDLPRVGSTEQGTLLLAGWAFGFRGEGEELVATLDGEVVATFSTGTERPDVWEYFHRHDNARFCGFTYELDISFLEPGRHALTIQCLHSPIPVIATFFKVLARAP